LYLYHSMLHKYSRILYQRKCIAPYAHIVLLDHVLDLQLHYVPIYIPLRLHPPYPSGALQER
jgi:hypothetical protein